MVLLLRGCIFGQRKLFTRELISFRRTIDCSAYRNDYVKRFTRNLQARYISTDKNENSERKLIYTGMMIQKVRNLKFFSLTSSAISLLLQPLFYMQLLELESTANIALIFVFINMAGIGSPLVIHMLAKRYVLEIYYNAKDNKYIATVYNFFFKRKEIEFSPDDVEVPGINMTALFTTCLVKKLPLLIDEEQFVDPKHYFIIMGYNKPVDFEVEKLVVRSLNQAPIIDKSHQIENKSKA